MTSRRHGEVVPCPRSDELPEVLIGPVHIGMVISDVPTRQSKELVVVRGPELVPARTVDDAAHEHLLEGMFLTREE